MLIQGSEVNSDLHHRVSSLLAACETRLQQLHSIVAKQQWDLLAQYTDAYQSEISELRAVCNNDLPFDITAEFIRLSNQQRRIMRAISQAQQTTTEDMDSTDIGLKQVKKALQYTQAANQA